MSDSAELLDWRCVVPPGDRTAEVPVYDPGTNCLYWVSMFEPSMNRTDLVSGDTTTWMLPSTAGSYGLFEDGSGAIVATEDGVHEVDFASSRVQKIHEAPYDRRDFRFNDGRCDPEGRFWVGTVRQPDSAVPNGSGFFYRIDGARLDAVIPGVTIANGIAFSPDGEVMYLADRINGRVLAYDFDRAAGTVARERVFTHTDQGWIFDGAAVDSWGGYWVAIYGSGRLHRYLPDGTLDRVIELPISHPTMCAFGGEDLGTLFLTTARTPLDAVQRSAQPLAGAILCVEVGEHGIPEPRFRRGIGAGT